ncbi:unnamed protein product [Clonostachys rhizophaga]|uniref:Uncharacterized protein n=1 Tax=Clonostachys rhizophaga TaxID=160324 RepID=A0A9N9VDM9_9HYPO|nr:unnamed protein product [Clonostachys rhizophaga]
MVVLTGLPRILNQLVLVLTKMGTDNGKGMTRRQSVAYLKWVLKELEMATIYPDGGLVDSDFIDPIGIPRPKTEPDRNRFGYDKWVSWAADAISDWPRNLFQVETEEAICSIRPASLKDIFSARESGKLRYG